MSDCSIIRRRFVDDPPHRNGFVACVAKISPGFAAARFEEEVRRKTGLDNARCVVGREFAVAIVSSESAQAAISSDGRRMGAVFGELHGPAAPHASSIAESETAPTAADIRNLNGSWAMFRFDADRDQAVFVTDRLNSRRVLYGRDGDTHWFASSLDLHPLRGGAIDVVAVGWYLTHGAIYGNRTPYEAIRVLTPSALHRISAAGVSSEQYWSPAFSSAWIAGVSERSLQNEFGDLLVDAVRCRIDGAGPLLVSLSAGYDAAGIAGILGERIRQPDVTCFSYARGTVKKDSDEYISAETAKRLGYRHDILTSYMGDYGSWIDTNARASHAMAGLCDEVDAWAILASRMPRPGAAILVGDECLGWTDYSLAKPADALRAVQIEGGPHVASARRVLNSAVCDAAVEGIESDIRAMLTEAPRFDDLHDLKDYFYITQRAPNYILPWRQNFASRVGSVRFPLLDSRVLDFMARVPAKLRRQKALYRRTIRQLCPTTFALPRATSASYHVNHAAEFAATGSSLMPLRSQALSEIVAPTLRDTVSAAATVARNPSGHRSVYKFIVKAIKNTALGDLLRKAQPAPPVRNPSPAELLIRLFCLDRALACDSPS